MPAEQERQENPKEPTLLRDLGTLAKGAWSLIPEKMGADRPAKMWEIGKVEILNALYPESNIGIPPVMSAAQIDNEHGAHGAQQPEVKAVESPLKGEFDQMLKQAQARPAQAKDQEIER